MEPGRTNAEAAQRPRAIDRIESKDGGYIYPSGAPSIHAKSAIMVDANSGKVLYYKNPDMVGPVASTQKIITAMLAIEEGLNDRVTIASSDTWVEPTKLYLKAGDSYTRSQLVNAILVRSSNDAAEALARDIAGSRAAFAARMNAYARRCGANNTRFVNPHGLPASGQYSTARDLAKIAYFAYRDPTLRRMVNQRGYRFRYADGRTKYLESTNHNLGVTPTINGMKTGYTRASGKCLITTASYQGDDIILVQLGSRTQYIFKDAERLITWGFQRNRFFATN